MVAEVDHRFLTPREAARHLGLTNRELTNLRISGRGPDWITIGRTVRYSKADLQWWLEHRGTTAT